MLQPEIRAKQIEDYSLYLQRQRGNHVVFTLVSLSTEVMFLVNIIAQICFLNSFLGGSYNLYGLDILKYGSGHGNIDPMIHLFPRVSHTTITFNFLLC